MGKSAPNNADAPMEYGRMLVQTGMLWYASDAGQAVAGPVTYSFQTGPKAVHLMGRIGISTGGTFQITEAPTLTPGTNIPFFQKNRVAAATSKKAFTASKTPTGVSGGTVVGNVNIASDSKGNFHVGVMDGTEDILLPNTTYLVTITLLASGNYVFDLEAYEE